VLEYLSPTWFEAADQALRSDVELAAASRGLQLVLQQSVDDPAPGVTWHIRIDDGRVRLVLGEAGDATVTFRCDRATAIDIHEGRTSAQAAFMAGRLRGGGDVGALLAHQQLLAGLNDVLAPLRGRGA
jgi:predicted lipid carrier protein YhbT